MGDLTPPPPPGEGSSPIYYFRRHKIETSQRWREHVTVEKNGRKKRPNCSDEKQTEKFDDINVFETKQRNLH